MILKRNNSFHDYLEWIKSGGSHTEESLEHLVHSMRKDAGGAKHSGAGRLRPSLIGDPCDRKQLLSYTFAEGSEWDGSWEAWSGTWLHLAFQAYLLDVYPSKLRIEHEIRPRKDRLGVTGKADWYWFGGLEISDMNVINGPHIGDYKTIGKLEWVQEAPRPMHVEQVLYEMYTTDVRKAYLVYQNRGWGGAMLTWEVTAEDEDLAKCEERLQRLTGHIERGELPDLLTPCLSRKGPYTDCNWRETCMREALK